jgi:aspartate aminotransferase
VALDAGAPIFADGIASLKSRRDLVLTEVKKISGVDYLPPQGAFYLFLDLRKRLNGRSTLDFSQHLLQSGHTAMVPGEAFGAPGFVRMSYAVSPDNIRAGLQALDRCLSSF